MHEWALAEAVLSTVLREAEKREAIRIKRIVIGLGSLQQIEKEIFRFALKELAKGTPLMKVKFSIKHVDARLKCNRCTREWKFSPKKESAELIHFLPEAVHAYEKCPSCGSPDFSIQRGRGVWIEKIEVE
jgi:hydrogenase nickel incorporation protein HypA/HybF